MTRKEKKAYNAIKAHKAKIANAKASPSKVAALINAGGFVSVNLKDLNALNETSIERGYNRNIYFDVVEKMLAEGMKLRGLWRGAETTVMLQPLMLHEHKAFESCEPHVRCHIFTDGICGFLTLDVDMNDFRTLIHTNKVYGLEEAA
ncbi:MAG: hypothetical protein HWE12_00975 [Oceanospirillaceae bacterium]|nr:hypothetical protein [Oceanospirillaceae bacterium]